MSLGRRGALGSGSMSPLRIAPFACFLLACSSSESPPATPESDTGAAEVASTAETGTDAATDASPEASDGGSFSEKLSEMGLFADIAKGTIAAEVRAFQPTHELWSDAASKRRWIWLPPGKKIDSTDMDHWKFPVGTRLWKEFAKDGKKLETRLIEILAGDEIRYGAYVWNAAQTDAVWTPDGAQNVHGTQHDVPGQALCQRCHDGEPGRILGFSALQLADAPGATTLATIAPFLTVAPVTGKTYGVPGTATEKAAIGYLHANCGHCHNPNEGGTFLSANIELRLHAGESVVAETKLYKSSVNVVTVKYTSVKYRIEGQNAALSAVVQRMDRRDSQQMPPLASEQIHPEAVTAVKAWIATLPTP